MPIHDNHLETDVQSLWVSPGHFYSPIPDIQEIEREETRIFTKYPPSLSGIDLRDESQHALLQQFADLDRTTLRTNFHMNQLRFSMENNDQFNICDATVLHCMLRHAQPKRYVEVGSGFSSAMTLDTNDLYLDGALRCTFIDPHPERLRALLQPGDLSCDVIPKKLQHTDRTLFSELEENDVLFVDSTHLLKTGGELNDILFEILPALSSGVYIHFHDIMYPFEYPQQWVYEGRAWNETYALRAFLQYNTAFDIVFFTSYLQQRHRDAFLCALPECEGCECGSLWLRKR